MHQAVPLMPPCLTWPQGMLPDKWMQCMQGGVPMPCMSQLVNFTCRACSLTGGLPSSWLSVQLQQLVLPDNLLFGPLSWTQPEFQVPPCQLQVLDLSHNNLDQVPDAAFWGRLGSGLQRLHVQGNAFGPTPLSGVHTARRRDVCLGGRVYPAHSCCCVVCGECQRIAHDSQLGTATQTLARQQSFKSIDHTRDAICMAAGLSLESITVVDVSRNSFKGTLPPAWLKSPSKLQFLNAAHNQLTGTIPREPCLHLLSSRHFQPWCTAAQTLHWVQFYHQLVCAAAQLFLALCSYGRHRSIRAAHADPARQQGPGGHCGKPQADQQCARAAHRQHQHHGLIQRHMDGAAGP